MPEDEIEWSLTDYEQCPEDPSKMGIDQHLNKAPVREPTTDEKFEVPERTKMKESLRQSSSLYQKSRGMSF